MQELTGTQHVTVIRTSTGQPCAAAHHERGHLQGYAVRGSATRIELGERADDALDSERYAGRRFALRSPIDGTRRPYEADVIAARLAALLDRRVISGEHRSRPDMVGKLSLLDCSQGAHERRAVDGVRAA